MANLRRRVAPVPRMRLATADPQGHTASKSDAAFDDRRIRERTKNNNRWGEGQPKPRADRRTTDYSRRGSASRKGNRSSDRLKKF